MTSDPDLEAEVRFFRGWSQMSSLLGGGVCPLEGGGGCLPSLPWWGEERERGDWHLNPGHLPRVTGYSMPMLLSHDQGR